MNRRRLHTPVPGFDASGHGVGIPGGQGTGGGGLESSHVRR